MHTNKPIVQTTEWNVPTDPKAIIQELGLHRHPEGGYYLETFRAPQSISTATGARNASTAIYYLLEAGDYSGWHRVSSDEAWHHYQGQPLHLHLLDAQGYRCVELGHDILSGQRPQFIVPAGTWQAAEVPSSGYALCGCTVAPGFDFSDFKMATLADLTHLFSDHNEHIERLVRTTNDSKVSNHESV